MTTTRRAGRASWRRERSSTATAISRSTRAPNGWRWTSSTPATAPFRSAATCICPQSNVALQFDRDAAHGHRLDIPAGTAVRFEPGVAQRVSLVPLSGSREVHGLSLQPPGRLDAP